MKYVYGPVPSRRLGNSLGIDTIPLKTCNWNCVYCQLGRTEPVVNQRNAYFPPDEIILEIREVLTSHQSSEIDWLTFVGSGEPALDSNLGNLIREVKKLSKLPVAVITNGALLYKPKVRQELSIADAVLPSLDAGTKSLYQKINRPHPETTFQRLLEGLISFRKEYSGWLWVEVMLVKGLNDTEDALRDISKALKMIEPDEIHINLPSRPPVEVWVQPPSEESILRACAILGDIARVVPPAVGDFNINNYEDITDAVISIITRHPMRQEEIEKTIEKRAPGKSREILTQMETSGRAQMVERYGVRFWCAAPSHFPDESQSLRVSPGRPGRKKKEV